MQPLVPGFQLTEDLLLTEELPAPPDSLFRVWYAFHVKQGEIVPVKIYPDGHYELIGSSPEPMPPLSPTPSEPLLIPLPLKPDIKSAKVDVTCVKEIYVPEKPSGGSVNWRLWALVVLVVITTGGGGYWYWRGKKDVEAKEQAPAAAQSERKKDSVAMPEMPAPVGQELATPVDTVQSEIKKSETVKKTNKPKPTDEDVFVRDNEL